MKVSPECSNTRATRPSEVGSGTRRLSVMSLIGASARATSAAFGRGPRAHPRTVLRAPSFEHGMRSTHVGGEFAVRRFSISGERPTTAYVLS